MKAKIIQTPSVYDVRQFLESVNSDSMLAALHPHRGLQFDPEAYKRTYSWLKHYAETGDFPPAD